MEEKPKMEEKPNETEGREENPTPSVRIMGKRVEWEADNFEALLARNVELRTSCDSCTKRKVRCIKGRPFSQCNACIKRNQVCVYSVKGHRKADEKKKSADEGEEKDSQNQELKEDAKEPKVEETKKPEEETRPPPPTTKRESKPSKTGPTPPQNKRLRTQQPSPAEASCRPKSAGEAKALEYVHIFLAIYERHFPIIDGPGLKSMTVRCSVDIGSAKSLAEVHPGRMVKAAMSDPDKLGEFTACWGAIATGAAISGNLDDMVHCRSIALEVHKSLCKALDKGTSRPDVYVLRAFLQLLFMHEAVGDAESAACSLVQAQDAMDKMASDEGGAADPDVVQSMKMLPLVCSAQTLQASGTSAWQQPLTPAELGRCPAWLRAAGAFRQARAKGPPPDPRAPPGPAAGALRAAYAQLAACAAAAEQEAAPPSLFERVWLEAALAAAEACPAVGRLGAARARLGRLRRALADRPAYVASVPALREAALAAALLAQAEGDGEAYKAAVTTFNGQAARRPPLRPLPKAARLAAGDVAFVRASAGLRHLVEDFAASAALEATQGGGEGEARPLDRPLLELVLGKELPPLATLEAADPAAAAAAAVAAAAAAHGLPPGHPLATAVAAAAGMGLPPFLAPPLGMLPPWAAAACPYPYPLPGYLPLPPGALAGAGAPASYLPPGTLSGGAGGGLYALGMPGAGLPKDSPLPYQAPSVSVPPPGNA